MMPIFLDPFEFKRYSKLHPVRLGFTTYARSAEVYARMMFDWVRLDHLDTDWVPVDSYNKADTAVTSWQMGALLHFLRASEALPGAAVVEIGSYRGITTSKFAQATQKTVYAVDPFIGYGGADADYEIFLRNTRNLVSIRHLRETSGAAAKKWKEQSITFLFIDAVHDYVNTAHDIAAWSTKLVPGGMMAMHDTDNSAFAGTRFAAWQAAKKMRLVCHIPDLVILQSH